MSCPIKQLLHNHLGGIIRYHCTNTSIDHAVQIVGYDMTSNDVSSLLVVIMNLQVTHLTGLYATLGEQSGVSMVTCTLQ